MSLLATLLLACGSAPAPDAHDHATHDEHAKHDEQPTHDEHAKHDEHTKHDGGAELALSLDGDAKWQMDDHTRTVMAETRATLDGGQLAAAEDASKLAATLQGQLDRLISGCTMDGASHDELHVFLMAYMPAVKALGTTSDLDAARAQVDTLRQMVTTYDAHFE